jgi:hypothetical protein
MPNEAHDAVVHHIASTRFPFPGQTTWPDGYITLTNVPEPQRSIETEAGPHYPDIVIVDKTGRTREIGEIEMSVDPSAVGRLKAASEATDTDTPTHVHHFFVYVPAGLEVEAQKLLEDNAISYAGVRGFIRDAAGTIVIVPFVTKGDPYDHQ